MESEKSAIKRSYFREYFFYKLRGTLGICIASAVSGLITCVLSSLIVYTMAKQIEREYDSGVYGYADSCITLFAGLVGMVIIAIIAPIVNFKYYRSRNSMDTLGCLPITYGQRFWGDFLSGLAAIVVPFSVTAAVGGIFLTLTQPVIDSVEPVRDLAANIDCADKNILLFGVKMYLIMLIIIVAAYSITTLVTSCCGKAGSSALYSVIALPIIPAVIGLYGTFTLDFAKGIIPERQINMILSCFPPVGTFIYLTLGMGGSNYYLGGESAYLIFPNAIMVIVSLLLISVMIAAAYLIGKKRKTERIGNGFAVSAMYHILTLLLVLAVIGVYFSANRILGLDMTKILIGAVITLVFYLILEFVQYRNFKKIWKSLVRYACVAVVGFGFLIAAMNTYGFGIGFRLPNQNDIVEITIESREFGISNVSETVKYRAEDTIPAILAENRKLIDNPDDISTGDASPQENGINFTYELKNGNTVSRYYRVNNHDLLDEVVNEIKKQPVYEIGRLGVLNRDDFTGITMTFRPHNEDGTTQNPIQIKNSRIPELAERLKYDIINGEGNKGDRDVGVLTAEVPEDERDGSNALWFIDESYTRTIEFLNNPDNFNNKSDTPVNDVKVYIVDYNYSNFEGEILPIVTNARAEFRSDSDSEYAKELMSYFVDGEDTGNGICFTIRTYDAETEDFLNEFFHVPNDKKQAALKALLNLIAEQNGSIQ